ncbi:MAG: ATP-dependent helicase [Elusimicrobiota bacterium]
MSDSNITLTDKQNIIVNKTGKYVVKACPGSGKTLTVALKLEKLITNWNLPYRGIAAISFTNVAWQEIAKLVEVRSTISYPHFIGTIDSFINHYIFLPFGHLAMNCGKRPELIGHPYNDWEPIGNGLYWGQSECNVKGCELNEFTYDIDGNIISFKPRSHFNKCSLSHRICQNQKSILIKSGYATQSDANYFAMKILETFPDITKALAHRFPILLLDEAQDTSKIQMKILELLIDNGLNEVMLVGDPDQAIYEWRTAEPGLFNEKYIKWQTNSEILNENWRSSQVICNYFHKISTLQNAPQSLNSYCKDYSFIPDIWEYDDDNHGKIVDEFLNICRKHSIMLSQDNIAIISRSREFLSKLTKEDISYQNPPWHDSCKIAKGFAESKYWFDNNEFKKAFNIIERTICKLIKKKDYVKTNEILEIISGYGLAKWRKNIIDILSKLPKTDCALGNWITETNNCFNNTPNIVHDISPTFILVIKKDKKPYFHSKLMFKQLFNRQEKSKMITENYTIGTVHSIKGETYEAVLLFVKQRGADNRGYDKILQSKIENDEELRIIYVAITRPRKILVIAVPKGKTSIWKSKFKN